MSARSFALLVNPASGGGAAPEAVVPVARHLRDRGASVEVTYSPGPQATRRLVAEAVDRGEVVVSMGGDGMLSSLAGEVARAGGTLGILPAGRGNDFARMLAIPADPQAQAELLLTGTVSPVDLLAYGGRLVAGSVYAGVDARASELVDRAHWLPVRLQYPYAAVRALATFSPARCRVSVDDTTRDYEAATVVVANSAYYGKGMRIAPDARVDDGLLDVVVIEAASRRRLIRSLPQVYDGTHTSLPQVHVLRGARVELSATTQVAVGADGEQLGVLPGPDAPAVVEVRPGMLRVIR
ncbi:diacylglycerol kinase [Nocardioides gansuensis]|uniref:Diacylglycerol kinase n=1 Tax=Nocardioides gansuensis TaxID=2138300 RepID=A0A2T8FEU4_9ACTN|nr:YegS/Rv2252/BmrU family lipid kinase [Nocardioides gansuensis]PVG84225.1 diacylglycerol kinase [Nocardioides gansuensis]